jgi:hypothetical protein
MCKADRRDRRLRKRRQLPAVMLVPALASPVCVSSTLTTSLFPPSIVATAALLDAACYCTICAGRSTRRVVRGGADGVEMTQSAPSSSSTVELLEGADWVVGTWGLNLLLRRTR